MLLWELLKIKVVQQPDYAPKFRFIAIAELFREILHNAGNNFGVLKVKWVGIILFKKHVRFVNCGNHRILLQNQSAKRGVER